MRVTRMLGLTVFAVLASSAMLAAASASATLTYKTCARANPKKTGDYTSKECTTASQVSGTGKYERYPSETRGNVKIKKVELYTAGVGTAVVCTKGEDYNLIASEAYKDTSVFFEDCKISGTSCTSGGAGAGEIGEIYGSWSGSLREPNPGVVEEGQSEELPGEPVIENFSCGGLHFEIRGGSSGVITGDINAATKKEAVTFSGAGGLEAETNDDPGVWLPLYETYTVVFKFQEQIGIFN